MPTHGRELLNLSSNEFLEYPRAHAVVDLTNVPLTVFTTAERVAGFIYTGTGVADTILATDRDGLTYFRWGMAADMLGHIIPIRFFAGNGLNLLTAGGAEPAVSVFWVDVGLGGNKTPQ